MADPRKPRSTGLTLVGLTAAAFIYIAKAVRAERARIASSNKLGDAPISVCGLLTFYAVVIGVTMLFAALPTLLTLGYEPVHSAQLLPWVEMPILYIALLLTAAGVLGGPWILYKKKKPFSDSFFEACGVAGSAIGFGSTFDQIFLS